MSSDNKESEKQKRELLLLHLLLLLISFSFFAFPWVWQILHQRAFPSLLNHITLWLQPNYLLSPVGKPRRGKLSSEPQPCITLSPTEPSFGIPRVQWCHFPSHTSLTLFQIMLCIWKHFFMTGKMCKVPFMGSSPVVSIIFLSLAFPIELFYFIKGEVGVSFLLLDSVFPSILHLL